MTTKLHKFWMNKHHQMYLDNKPLKGVQAMQLTMDVKNPNLAVLNLVMIAVPSELEHDQVDVTVETPKEEPKKENV